MTVWLGVAATGPDMSSNSLSVVLQVTAAKQSAASSAGASSFCSPCA